MFEVGFGKSAKEDIIGAPLPPSDRGRGETANELGGRFVWRSCFSGTKRDVAAIRLGVIGAQHLPGTVPNGTDPGELQTALRKSGHDRSRGASALAYNVLRGAGSRPRPKFPEGSNSLLDYRTVGVCRRRRSPRRRRNVMRVQARH